MGIRCLLIVLLCIYTSISWSQTYEIGAYGGGANNIGDVGRMNFIAPSGPAFGGIFKWNKSKR